MSWRDEEFKTMARQACMAGPRAVLCIQDGAALNDKRPAIARLESLGCAARLKLALVMHGVIAWHVNRLVLLAHTPPEPDAALASACDEWRAAVILNRNLSQAESCV